MHDSDRIQRSDIESLLVTHVGNRTLEQTLRHIEGEVELLRLLGRYVLFNSVFGGGVANLAGEVATRPDLFRDPEEPAALMADRSVEVAADVFYAAIDEFGDLSTGQRCTHRMLAQATLKAACDFYGYNEPQALDAVASPNEPTLAAMRRVRDGYCLNQTVDEQKLLRGLGFHMGSEILADREFNILDRYLCAEQPELVRHLRMTKIKLGGHEAVAYLWILIHSKVEAEHYEAALHGANLALRYYAGAGSKRDAKEWVLAGFREFAAMQAEFMKHLIEQ